MSHVAIKKVNDNNKTLPIFAEMAKRFEAIQKRAFDLFEKRGGEPGRSLEDWLCAEREVLGWPAAELTEKDGVYTVEIALPGFQSKDVEVTATPSEIMMHAVTSAEKKTQKGDVLWTEFGSNDVYRRFEVPQPIDVEHVTARLDNGILYIQAAQTSKPKAFAAKAA